MRSIWPWFIVIRQSAQGYRTPKTLRERESRCFDRFGAAAVPLFRTRQVISGLITLSFSVSRHQGNSYTADTMGGCSPSRLAIETARRITWCGGGLAGPGISQAEATSDRIIHSTGSHDRLMSGLPGDIESENTYRDRLTEWLASWRTAAPGESLLWRTLRINQTASTPACRCSKRTVPVFDLGTLLASKQTR
jgi:hypothetical protein